MGGLERELAPHVVLTCGGICPAMGQINRLFKFTVCAFIKRSDRHMLSVLTTPLTTPLMTPLGWVEQERLGT